MNRHVNAIAGRLSLRAPQRESLEILDRVTEIVPPKKNADLNAALAAIKSEFPTVTDFEREFPSLCFALATGVGKTRLMGAFISYLHLAHGINHFFVLAPNLTIYNKLIADFTPNKPKYVFTGIAEFATEPPTIITGDNYESGVAARLTSLPGFGQEVHINIFNVSKITSEMRGGKAPRIKRLSEYIGQSYFEYLAGLDDLVLLMDESHRYRASQGVKAINELKPVLGLELTATPKVRVGSNAQDFKNVVYRYMLADALNDGFVKEPAVVTRENFDPTTYKDRLDELDRIKLEDGVGLHEITKVELEVYGRQNEKAVIKPFVLVVARNTEHANQVEKWLKSDTFFHGRYKDKVITVHSNQSGEVEDEALSRLLDVENSDEPTEIVIHVNKLGEGWDVTNLYTIIPLRAFAAEILTEQTLGRGLRLPYGHRTNVPAIDRLSIVAHDRFQEIVDAANRPDSIIRASYMISPGGQREHKKIVHIQPLIFHRLGVVSAQEQLPIEDTKEVQPLFTTPAQRAVAQVILEVIQQKFPRKSVAHLIADPEAQAAIAKEVALIALPIQGELPGVEEQPNIEEMVKKITALLPDLVIQIPRVYVWAKDASGRFDDFDLDVSTVTQLPVSDDVLVQTLRSNEQIRLKMDARGNEEGRLEDYVVRHLIDKNDINYDQHADLLYKLAGQVVGKLRSYLPTELAITNVITNNQLIYAELIYQQMQAHYVESLTEWESKVTPGFNELCSTPVPVGDAESVRDFRVPVDDKRDIRAMYFGGFAKCLYDRQKFDSDSERRFAVILEQDDSVLKWFKPMNDRSIRIDLKDSSSYRPDFIVEGQNGKFICEPKMRKEMEDSDVIAKAQAARTWCQRATEYEVANGGKPWKYVLIPHDVIAANMTLAGLASQYAGS